MAAGAVIALAACGSTAGSGAVGGTGQPPSAAPNHSAASGQSAGSGQPAGSAGSQGPPAAVRASLGVPLCAAARRVDRVVVTRSSTMRPGSFHEILPRGILIRDAPRVRALAAALCALPPMPGGLHCPADFGGVFRLLFAAGTRGFPPVGIQVSGCRIVTGVGHARWWSRSPPFGRVLAQALGGKGSLIRAKPGNVPPGP